MTIGGRRRDAGENFVDLVGGAEKKWAVDAEDGDVVRDYLVLQDVGVAVLHVFVGDGGNGGGFGDFADENEGGEDHAGFDGDGEVGENGEGESDQPDADIERRELQQLRDFFPFAHVVRNHQQDGGEYGERDEPRERGGKENDCQQGESVNHSGYWGFRAGTNVGGGAGDGSGSGQAAEEGRDNIGDALGHEFDIGIVFGVAHAVGNHGGHQRLDGAEHGDGHRRRDERAHQVQMKARNIQMRAGPMGIPPKRVPIVSTGSLKATTIAVPSEERDDVARNFFHVAHANDDDRQRKQPRGRWWPAKACGNCERGLPCGPGIRRGLFRFAGRRNL